MKYRDKELLQGMRNCYSVCGCDFEETIEMVSSARDRDPEEVKETLLRLGREYGHTKTYQKLRTQIPEEFAF
ncbi:MAG: hypothetical protein ACW98K_16935 [Candidatus Kariarchaeaceae archaeon]